MPKSKDVGFEEVNVDMTPMIDVTFLLLIFFVIISTLARMETAADVELPMADQAQTEEAPDREQLVINVEADGDIFIIGEKRDEEQVASLLRQEALKSMGPDKFSTRSIVIRGHQKVPYEKIQTLMSQCLTNGIWKLHLAAKGPEP